MESTDCYCRPASVSEAVRLKSRLGERGVFLAGGTDLMLKLPRPFQATIIDLSAAGLDAIELRGDALHIGAMVTAHRIAADPLCGRAAPLLAKAARELGSPQIRSVATIGGNAVNASPSADLAVALGALDAIALLRDSKGERRLPAIGLALSPGRSACGREEILIGFEIPCRRSRDSFQKLGLRDAQAIAVASVAASGRIGTDGKVEHLAVACGSVAPRIVRAVAVERALIGEYPAPGLIAEASRLVLKEISPISDIRGTAEYRRMATVGILFRALTEVLTCC